MSPNPKNRKSNENWPNWRRELHNVIFEADTVAGKAFDVLLLILIVISIVAVMLDSVASVNIKYEKQINIIEWIVTIFFTIEYIARILAVKQPKKYIFSFYGLIDLFSTLPSYFALFFVGAQGFLVLRALRLLRIFRVLKLVRFSSASDTISKALIASRYKITVFMIAVVTLVTIIGAIMYLIESPTNSGFESIPKSIYWAVVTLTTVGYGDISPQTPLGQFMASLIMILGYGIIAVPTGIVSAEMASMNDKDENEHMNHSCINCGAENHQSSAKYCFRCGSDLEK